MVPTPAAPARLASAQAASGFLDWKAVIGPTSADETDGVVVTVTYAAVHGVAADVLVRADGGTILPVRHSRR